MIPVLSRPTRNAQRAVAAGGAFDPSTITGLKGWFKADAGAYKDAGVTLAADTETLQRWADQSGNANHVNQATAGLRPTYRTGILNGLPVVRFSNASDTRLLSSNLASLMSQPNTLYAVAVPTTTSLSGLRIFVDGNDASNRNVLYLNSGTYGWYAGSLVASSTAGSNGVGVVASAVFNGASSTFRINAGSDDTGSPGAAGLNGFCLGNYQGGGFGFDGDLGEVLIYAGSHNSTDRANVVSYLRTRWGI